MTKSIDDWTADKCGVELVSLGFQDNAFKYKGRLYEYYWTIKDPRCREIVRKDPKFLIHTHTIFTKEWIAVSAVSGIRSDAYKELSDAEIECIENIHEAEK